MLSLQELEKRRLFCVLATIVLSVSAVLFFAEKPWSDGRTASWLCAANLSILLAHTLAFRDSGMLRLLWFGLCFGVVELGADYLCVRFTGTLDYSPSGSWSLGLSPWWMPAAWMVVIIPIGLLGAMAVDRFGVWRGSAGTGILGALQIPFYEEMAHHAHWWSYSHCRMVAHTPVYIVVAELLIGASLAITARRALHSPSLLGAGVAGVSGGLCTIGAGLIGYGVVERLLPGLELGRVVP